MGLTRIEKILPGARWLRGYTAQYALADFIAGITVGLTIIPQALAYATLAGLAPQYGLYSAFIGGFIYALVGGCPEVNIGPTALLALMTSRHTGLGGESGPHLAILLCFLSGIIQIIIAVLRLGALVDLISLPVTVGFTSATALIIAGSQLKGLLGLEGGSGSGFLQTMYSVFGNIHESRVGDMILGFSCLIILLALRKLKEIKSNNDASRGRKIISLIAWIIGTSRNALIVLFSSLGAYYSHTNGKDLFLLTGNVRTGLPEFGLPPFSTTTQGPNSTIIEMNFMGMVKELGPSIALVPVIAVLGNVAIAKAFGGSGSINATRELIALSLSNVFGSFVSSMPITGSFSRSAVNHASGVKTPIGGIYTGALVLLAVGILTPYFHFIPKAALSAVIISAVIFMIEYEVVRPLWRCSRRELLPGAVTFILSLWISVEIGLLAGVGTDLAFLVYRAARPVLSTERFTSTSGVEYVLIRPRHSLLYFPAIEWVRNGVSKAVKDHGTIPMVLDCRNVHEFDFTAARGLGSIHKELSARGVALVLLGQHPDVKQVLKGAVSTDILEANCENELDELLQNLVAENKSDTRDVIIPLLQKNNENHCEKRK